MRLVIADGTLGSTCEDPAVGVAVLGEAAFESLSLVIDVLSPLGVDLETLAGLRFMSVQVDFGPAPRVEISTRHVRIAFIPLTHTSTGELAMISDHVASRRMLEALQLVEVVALTGSAGTAPPRRAVKRTERS
jgi:hypothetical protein